MPSRLIQLVVPVDRAADVASMIGVHEPVDAWHTLVDGDRHVWTFLVAPDRVERLLDAVEDRFGTDGGYRLVVTGVDAVLPRPEPVETTPEPASDIPTVKREPRFGWSRISREELYQDIVKGTAVTPRFLVEVTLATVIAVVGLQRDQPAITIAAMIIAPLLGPNMALALATALGDIKLGRQALRTNVLGAGLAFLLALAVGFVWSVDVSIGEIEARTAVSLSDVVLALAAGIAGALSFTAGLGSALVGVMVAVALLPPLVVFAMLIAAGQWDLAMHAFVLLATNVVCVNLASVMTFVLQGIRPRRWYEAARSRRATRIAMILWSVILAVLTVLILLQQRGG